MTRYRANQNELKPAIPLIFLTDSTLQQVGTGGTLLTWDTAKIKTSHFKFTEGKDRIYLNTNSSGLFEIRFETSVTEVSAADSSDWWIYKNGSVITESQSICKSNDSGSDGVYVHIHYFLYLEQGDYITIYGEGNGGAVYAKANTTRLSIKFIPMKGWNNSSGGRADYRGRVLR